MQKFVSLFLFIAFLQMGGCAQQRPLTSISGEAVAFPGAEGFGKYTKGGRGGKVFIVTNLDDSGPGSFREAAIAKIPRIIVFAVSGTIHLATPLNIRGDATIAGQTAPGDGICIADQPVSLNGNNIIVRYMRFRLGDRYQNKGQVHGSGHDDAFSANNRKHIIIDHCSFSWSNDEVLSVYNGDSVTLQWNIISEPLNYSYHFETGDKDFEHHGYGGIWGGKHLSAHHNLFAHCLSRNPRFAGIRSIPEDFVDYRNNVIYNWGANNVYGGEGGRYNMINNYFKYGPSTKKSVQFQVVNPSRQANPPIGFGKFHVQGNYVDGSEQVSNNNELGVRMSDGTEEDKKQALTGESFDAVAVNTTDASSAYEDVLRFAGASFKRDTLDHRITIDVRDRKGRIIDVQGGFPHGTAYELTTAAWPNLQSLPAQTDTDRDGMPDQWEKDNKLDPSNAADAAAYGLHRNFTNIEIYINSISEQKK